MFDGVNKNLTPNLRIQELEKRSFNFKGSKYRINKRKNGIVHSKTMETITL